MKGFTLKAEEYVPAATFLKTSFVRDREELSSRFSEFTPDYLAGFEAQLTKVTGLEQALILTEEQKGITASLYDASNVVNKDLNFLSFYFERAGLDTAIVTGVKKDLTSRNVEGACLKLAGLIQFITGKSALLESKGMNAGFPAELDAARVNLMTKNELQNKVMDTKKQLYKDNKAEYDKLYDYVSMIAKAGKIMYDGMSKKDEYTVTKLISRMRGGGGSVTPPVA